MQTFRLMAYFLIDRFKAWVTVCLVLSIVFSISGCSSDTESSALNSTIELSDIRTHVEYLASDELKGREAGTPGEARAANYIADRFRNFGLSAAGDDETYLQLFNITTGVSAVYGSNWLQARGFQVTMEDSLALPWGGSASEQTEGDLVFAGYGITAPELGYDDYQDISVRDRVVLIMRYGPGGTDNPHADFGSYWEVGDKVKRVADQGARAVIITAGPMHDQVDRMLPVERKQMVSDSQIPVLQITPEAAGQLLKRAGISIRDRQRRIEESGRPASVATDMRVEVTVELKEKQRMARNVVGMLRGSELPDEYIVIGAHYDHLGMGTDGSLYRGDKPQVHNGADDNASGTAGLMELAHYFSNRELRKSLLFVAFSGEEMGLLGSRHFVNNPPVPVDQMMAMINMDMIGRLTEHQLMIYGTGSSESWPNVLEDIVVDSLEIKRVPDGVGASDHTSFYNNEVPVLHYFTDTHADYHRPSDDPQWINYEGTRVVLTHIRRVVEKLDSLSADQLAYTKAPVTQNRDVTLKGPTLGVLPDYGYNGPGMRITGVNEGGPADRAGVKDGDVFVQLAGREIRDIYDYMDILNDLKEGEKTTITIKRDEDELTLGITL